MRTPLHTTRRLTRCAAAALATAAAAACSESVTAPVPPAPTGAIAQIVTDIYLPTLDSIAGRAASLVTALAALAAAPSDNTLAAAQDAWRDTRRWYERNEGFPFGPLETGGFDPAMDTWPVDVAGIDALLAGHDPLDADGLALLDGTLKGFHGIEYILFGLNGHTTVAALTPRALQYLIAAGTSLAGEAAGLYAAWSPESGDYAGQLTTAGTEGSVYASIGAALQDIVGGIIDPVDEVASSKIGAPLQTGSSELEESRFSDNTITDLENNLTGAYRVYLGGDAPASALGISALVASQDPALDQLVRQRFDQALAALAAAGPSFDATLHGDPALLQTAQQALLELEQTLTARVVPLTGSAEDAD